MMILGLRLNLLRVLLKSSRHLECFNSTVVTNVGVHLSPVGNSPDKVQNLSSSDEAGTSLGAVEDSLSGKGKSRLVAAAFASLGHVDTSGAVENPSLDDKIKTAKTVDELLSLMDNQIISKGHAFKVFSILSTWTSQKKIEISELETDIRFLKLCKFLNKSVSKHLQAAKGDKVAGGPNIVTEVTNEDVAAKLSSTLELPQLVKVLHSLAMKQKRSLTLLRSLVYNITENPEDLNVKQCADVLYSLASLNYPDEVLMCRVTADLYKCIETTERPSVIKSIIQSIGMLKYRDTELLDQLSEWILKHHHTCRPQELSTLIQTLAAVNFKPSNEEVLKAILPSINQDQGMNVSGWLKIVWSLAVLGEATDKQVMSVLQPEFVDKLIVTWDSLPFAFNLKLLQLYGYASLVLQCSDAQWLAKNQELKNIPLLRSKDKQVYVNGVFTALSNLLPSSVYLSKDINSGYGYLIDGVCQIDDKLTPIALIDKKTGKRINEDKGTKIAIMVHDFHDFCRGSHNKLDGANSLFLRLTELSGYKVMSVPFHEFNLSDKLPTRVQYLEDKVKMLLKSK